MFKQIIFSMSLLLSAPFAASAQVHYKQVENISYVASGDTSAYRRERCKLDIYYPAGTRRPFKTVVWFHGGGLEAGHKELPAEFRAKGFAVVGVNYRLSPRAKNPEYTYDAAAAVAWVYRHIAEYGGSPSEVFVSGHSAGGYLTLMLCLDKSYLASYGVDADSIAAYLPIGGQTATHFTIRKERHISYTTPLVDRYAPLNNVRKFKTRLVLMTGDRHLELMARYEENLYLKAVLEGIGNATVPLYEMQGFGHVGSVAPARLLVARLVKEWR